MRVAIIGGNLLGTSCAFYIRRALNQDDSNHSTIDHQIDIFEQRKKTGGNKLRTLILNQQKTTIGTARHFDYSKSPLLQALFSDANIIPPSSSTQKLSWALFDWKENSYLLWQNPNKFLNFLITQKVFITMLRILLLLVFMHAINIYRNSGWTALLLVYNPTYTEYFPNYSFILFMCSVILLGGGIIPLQIVFKFYDFLWVTYNIPLIAAITYGDHTLRITSTLVEQFQQHLQAIVEQDAASSCITLTHLLSACGLAKYAKVSTMEFFNKYNLSNDYLKHIPSGPIQQIYTQSTMSTNSNINALAVLMTLCNSVPVPTKLRRKASYLDADQTENLCDEIAKAANAKVYTNTIITKVMKMQANKYKLSGCKSNGKEQILGEYDAIILAAVIDPSSFQSDALDEDNISCFALHDYMDQCKKLSQSRNGINSARYISLVKGNFKSEYVRRSNSQSMARMTTILDSVNCSEVSIVADNFFRVATSEIPTKESNVTNVLFEDMEQAITAEKNVIKYEPKPLSKSNDEEDSPTMILANRFVNAACIDRIGNDPNLDLLAARNVGSLFKKDVAKWKDE